MLSVTFAWHGPAFGSCLEELDVVERAAGGASCRECIC